MTREERLEYGRRWRLMNREAWYRSRRLNISMDEARKQIADEDEAGGLRYTDLHRYAPNGKDTT